MVPATCADVDVKQGHPGGEIPMRQPQFIRSNTFHWALMVAGVFAVFVIVLFGFIYWQIDDYLTARSDRVITLELEGIAGLSPERRLQAIDEKLRQDPRGVQLAAIFAADGHRITGNVENLPPDLRIDGAAQAADIVKMNGNGRQQQVVRAIARRMRNGDVLVLGRNVEDAVPGQYAMDLARPLLPRRRAPEIIDPQEAALQQVLAQPRRFFLREFQRADIGRHRERAAEQRIIGEPDDPGGRLAFALAADRRLGQLRHARHQVDAGIGIVRRPAHALRFTPDAPVHDFANHERAVFEVPGGKTRRDAGALRQAALSPLRRHGRRESDCTNRCAGGDHAAHPEAHGAIVARFRCARSHLLCPLLPFPPLSDLVGIRSWLNS